MNELKGRIKKVGDYYVKFGASEHQYHAGKNTIEILDWVKCTNVPGTEIHISLKTMNKQQLSTFEGRTFADISFMDESWLRGCSDVTENEFWSAICNRILFYVVQRNKDINMQGMAFQTDFKMTEERRALMFHMTIPVTIVHSII